MIHRVKTKSLTLSSNFTHPVDVIPDRASAKVDVEVGVRSAHAHQAEHGHLKEKELKMIFQVI